MLSCALQLHNCGHCGRVRGELGTATATGTQSLRGPPLRCQQRCCGRCIEDGPRSWSQDAGAAGGRALECGARSRAAHRARSRLGRPPLRGGRRAHDICDRRALVSILQRTTRSVCGRAELVLLGLEGNGVRECSASQPSVLPQSNLLLSVVAKAFRGASSSRTPAHRSYKKR